MNRITKMLAVAAVSAATLGAGQALACTTYVTVYNPHVGDIKVHGFSTKKAGKKNSIHNFSTGGKVAPGKERHFRVVTHRKKKTRFHVIATVTPVGHVMTSWSNESAAATCGQRHYIEARQPGS